MIKKTNTREYKEFIHNKIVHIKLSELDNNIKQNLNIVECILNPNKQK